MTTPAEYRRFALDCMREADGTESAAMREMMIGFCASGCEPRLKRSRT